jgi:exodeoxyribonuclease V
VRNRLARPQSPLSVDDLKREPAPLALGEASPSLAGDLG